MSYSNYKLSSYLRSPYTAPSSNSSTWKSTPLIGNKFEFEFKVYHLWKECLTKGI